MSKQISTAVERSPLLAVVGATATGKTASGIALARAFDGEIVGADSRQVYRGMAIGTAQPSAEELAAAPHHLIGFLSPAEPFGLATYLDMAAASIAAIRARGRRPIIVGGTGQFIWALLEGWTVPRVLPDAAFRAELEQYAAQHGPEALHTRLRGVDEPAALLIHPRNVRRVIRALEVIRHTGEPFSAQRRRLAVEEVRVVGLSLERTALYNRIDRRLESMYEHGLLEEVRDLARQGFSADLPSMASIGYPEAWAAVNGEISCDEAIRRTQFATHRLVRLQSTWFRSGDARIRWVDVSSASDPQVLAGLVVAAANGDQ